MAKLACGLLTLGAVMVSASAQTPSTTFPPDKNGTIVFVTPSKNIGCTFTQQGGTPIYQPFDGGPELSCDRIAPKYVSVVLTPKNFRRFNNPCEQGCCDETNVLAHGALWSHGPFTCDSAEAGLTCKRTDGKGFFIGPKDIKTQ